MVKIKKQKILFVEDEEVLVQKLSQRLIKEEFRVFTARNGREGLGVALTQKPDLIVLDLLLPVMDGIEMLQELRKSEFGKTAQVLILSNLSNEKIAKQAKDLGVIEYLVKTDLKLSEVAARIKQILK